METLEAVARTSEGVCFPGSGQVRGLAQTRRGRLDAQCRAEATGSVGQGALSAWQTREGPLLTQQVFWSMWAGEGPHKCILEKINLAAV